LTAREIAERVLVAANVTKPNKAALTAEPVIEYPALFPAKIKCDKATPHNFRLVPFCTLELD
jgi:hypothetical protein